VGTWLSVFREHGVGAILGIDGDYVDATLLRIRPDEFLAHDLETPLNVDRSFDLVLSLEVAEHLPEACAETFVESLTRLGPVVLFSAAVPFQGGIHHINEQWPGYWAELFSRRGYRAFDSIRPRVWDDKRVLWWYAQNSLLFVDRRCLDRYPRLPDEPERPPLALIHPRPWVSRAGPQAEPPSLRSLLRHLPRSLWNAIRRRAFS
jgi:hypothetical protein